MKHSILTAIQGTGGQLILSVIPNYAESLWQYFKDHGIVVSQLSDAVARVRNWKQDEEGRLFSDEIDVVRQFQAEVPYENLADLVGDWFSSHVLALARSSV